MYFLVRKQRFSPDQYGSVGWASSHKVKGRWLDSQAGHTPRLQVQFLVRAHTRGNQSMFLSLSFSFHSPLSKTNENEIFLKYKLFPHYNLLTIFNKNVLTEKKNHTNYYNSKHNFLGHRSMWSRYYFICGFWDMATTTGNVFLSQCWHAQFPERCFLLKQQHFFST